MCSGKWSEDITYKFVCEYVKRECLWNSKHPQYKHKYVRAEAYYELEKVMNLPDFGEKEIVNKIKNLRSTYSQELKKIKESKSPYSEYEYTPSIKWFTIMDSALRQNNVDKKILGVDNLETDFSSETITGDTANSPERVIVSESPKLIPRKRKPNAAEVIKTNETVRDSAPKANEHEFDIFGECVAAQLKGLPLETALQAQQFIHNYLISLRLKQFDPLPTNFMDASP